MEADGQSFLGFFDHAARQDRGRYSGRDRYWAIALDAATAGYGPQLVGGQDAVAQARSNLGIVDPLVQGIGYVAGPGKILGPLARGTVGALAPAVTAPAASLAARVAGSAAAGGLEGAAAGGVGALGHGGGASDVVQGAGVGALTGMAAGGLFGGSGPRPRAPDVGLPQSSTGPATGMYAQKTTAYSPLDSSLFNDHGNAINQGQAMVRAVRDPYGQGVDLGIPADVNDILGKLQNNPIVSGRNSQEASSALRDNGDWTAHRFADALDNHLNTAQPMSINGAPTGQVGEAGAAKRAGDLWYQRIQDLNRLSQELSTGTPGPTPSAIQTTKGFYDQGSPQYDALTALQGAARPGFNWSHLRHAVAPLAFEGAALGEHYLDPDDQYPWLRAGLHGLAAGSMFTALPAIAAARPGPAINAARYAIGTGQPISTATGRVGDSLLKLLLGRAAANQSPY